MSSIPVQNIALVLAELLNKKLGTKAIGPCRIARSDLYEFTQRKQFRSAFLDELRQVLLTEHGVHLLDGGDTFFLARQSDLSAWRKIGQTRLLSQKIPEHIGPYPFPTGN
jgi:hypothetical protein